MPCLGLVSAVGPRCRPTLSSDKMTTNIVDRQWRVVSRAPKTDRSISFSQMMSWVSFRLFWITFVIDTTRFNICYCWYCNISSLRHYCLTGDVVVQETRQINAKWRVWCECRHWEAHCQWWVMEAMLTTVAVRLCNVRRRTDYKWLGAETVNAAASLLIVDVYVYVPCTKWHAELTAKPRLTTGGSVTVAAAAAADAASVQWNRVKRMKREAGMRTAATSEVTGHKIILWRGVRYSQNAAEHTN